MDIIPVIDIRDGEAVAGKRGERENYRPLKTVFSKTSDPLTIADALPYARLYVADLDGIGRRRPGYQLLKKLSEKKKTLIDAGVESFRDVKPLADFSCDIILGTETVNGLDVIRRSIDTYRDRTVISLDVKHNRVLTKFLPSQPLEAVKVLEGEGAKRIILLDISSVGTLRGCRYELLGPMIKKFPSVEFIVGGGITAPDIEKMEKIGVKAVLVGTALHRGLLGI